MKEGLLPVRTLVDTDASHCSGSQAYVEQADIPARQHPVLAVLDLNRPFEVICDDPQKPLTLLMHDSD